MKSTDKRPIQAMPQVIIPAVTTRPIAARTGAAPGTVYPGQSLPVATTPVTSGVAVYTPPKIARTELAAYEDEKGRLFGPQVMYEKVEEGRFNAAALQNPELAYIPQENLVVPPGMGNPASAVAMQRVAEEAPRMPTDYIDPRDVLVTGLLGKDANRAEADRMATAAGRRPVFDPDIGWILVPPSVVK
jgi:hypothetical protein